LAYFPYLFPFSSCELPVFFYRSLPLGTNNSPQPGRIRSKFNSLSRNRITITWAPPLFFVHFVTVFSQGESVRSVNRCNWSPFPTKFVKVLLYFPSPRIPGGGVRWSTLGPVNVTPRVWWGRIFIHTFPLPLSSLLYGSGIAFACPFYRVALHLSESPLPACFRLLFVLQAFMRFEFFPPNGQGFRWGPLFFGSLVQLRFPCGRVSD